MTGKEADMKHEIVTASRGEWYLILSLEALVSLLMHLVDMVPETVN